MGQKLSEEARSLPRRALVFSLSIKASTLSAVL
jgi:hypothetical protein